MKITYQFLIPKYLKYMCSQTSLETMASFVTEEIGRCKEVAIMGRKWCNMKNIPIKLKPTETETNKVQYTSSFTIH